MKIADITFENDVPYENIKVCLDALSEAGLKLTSNNYSSFKIIDPDLKEEKTTKNGK